MGQEIMFPIVKIAYIKEKKRTQEIYYISHTSHMKEENVLILYIVTGTFEICNISPSSKPCSF
jgi:hypothetical protein